MRQRIFLPLLLITITLLLTACASGDNVATAADYLEALGRGDLDAAAALACPAEAESIASAMVTPSEEANFSFQNIRCVAEGDDVSCRFTVEQDTRGEGGAPERRARQVVFDFVDGQVCGFEEQVAQ